MTLPRRVIVFLVLLALLQTVHYAPRLPGPVASHFNAAGEPDGWSSRTAFLLTNLAFMLGLTALLVGMTGLLPRIPDAWINLPHKDYWLAPERRHATFSALQRQMEWLAAATLALFIAMTQATIDANLIGPPPASAFWWPLAVYLLFMALWLVRLLRWAYTRPAA